MTDGSSHEELPEEWVQGLEDLWESVYDPDDLAALRSQPPDPLDRFLYDAFRALRRIRGSIALRIDSKLPVDEGSLDAVARDKVHDALGMITSARQLIADAVGEDRILELERERLGHPDEPDQP